MVEPAELPTLFGRLAHHSCQTRITAAVSARQGRLLIPEICGGVFAGTPTGVHAVGE